MATASLTVALGDRSYDIIIGPGCLGDLGSLLIDRLPATKHKYACIITDSNVADHYLKPVRAAVSEAGYEVSDIVFPAGEQAKSLSMVEEICQQLAGSGLDRSSFLVALGGGVTGDLTGFVSAAYMRGIPYVQVPTTLLAQVDSSVGGKTAVNLPAGKNLVGAFWQPRLVLADIRTLETLSERDFREGLAEVIKYGVIYDRAFFDWLDAHREAVLARDADALRHIVLTSCRIKARVVEADECEGGLRAILNYGHTFGHGIEKVTNYQKLRHGEGVSIGMVAAARTAAATGRISEAEAGAIESLISRYGLPVELPEGIEIQELIASFSRDKKARAGCVVFVLPDRIGQVALVDDVPRVVLENVLSGMSPRN